MSWLTEATAFQITHIFLGPVFSVPLQHHQLFWLLNRQHAQHHGINRTEDSGVGTDPKRQRSNYDCRKSRSFAQHTSGITQVLKKGLDEMKAAGFTVSFFGLGNAAKMNPCRLTCLLLRHTLTAF